MLVWLTLPFYNFCGVRSVSVNSLHPYQTSKQQLGWKFAIIAPAGADKWQQASFWWKYSTSAMC